MLVVSVMTASTDMVPSVGALKLSMFLSKRTREGFRNKVTTIQNTGRSATETTRGVGVQATGTAREASGQATGFLSSFVKSPMKIVTTSPSPRLSPSDVMNPLTSGVNSARYRSGFDEASALAPVGDWQPTISKINSRLSSVNTPEKRRDLKAELKAYRTWSRNHPDEDKGAALQLRLSPLLDCSNCNDRTFLRNSPKIDYVVGRKTKTMSLMDYLDAVAEGTITVSPKKA